MTRLCTAIALTVGCSGGELDTEPDATPVASCSGFVPPPACPDDALIPSDGRSEWDIPMEPVYVPSCQALVGAPVAVRLDEDVRSLSVTVAAGSLPTEMVLWRDDSLIAEKDPSIQSDIRLQSTPASTTLLPNSHATEIEAGCWYIEPMVSEPALGEEQASVHINVQRGEVANATLRMLPVFVGDVVMSPDDLDRVLGLAEAVFGAGDFAFERLEPVTLAFDAGENDFSPQEVHELIQSWSDPDNTGAAPVFFLDSFTSFSLLGLAAAIPGSWRPGMASCGVTVALDRFDNSGSLDTDYLAAVVAHELGHLLGLWHTTEVAGDRHDPIADTPECPDRDGSGTVYRSECPGDEFNLMFWAAAPGAEMVLSDEQRWVLSRSPFLQSAAD